LDFPGTFRGGWRSTCSSSTRSVISVESSSRPSLRCASWSPGIRLGLSSAGRSLISTLDSAGSLSRGDPTRRRSARRFLTGDPETPFRSAQAGLFASSVRDDDAHQPPALVVFVSPQVAELVSSRDAEQLLAAHCATRSTLAQCMDLGTLPALLHSATDCSQSTGNHSRVHYQARLQACVVPSAAARSS
jgi:hypothetical protein